MNVNEIPDPIYQELHQSPTFQLSLGSKELFHSNFMSWLADRYRKPFANMLKDIIGKTDWLEEFAENKYIDDQNEVPKYVIMRKKITMISVSGNKNRKNRKAIL